MSSDSEKKKYFKIQANHLAPGSRYSRDEVNKRTKSSLVASSLLHPQIPTLIPNSDIDCSQKRKRIAAREQRASQEMVKRSKILNHPLGGAVGLQREASARLASTRKILNQ